MRLVIVGPPLPFTLDSERALKKLTPRQRAQFNAALTFHALVNPGANIETHVTISEINEVPRLTDPTTRIKHYNRDSTITVRATSTASGVGEHRGETLVRHLRLAHDEANPSSVEPPRSKSTLRRLYTSLERSAPRLTDALREGIMRFRARELNSPLPRYPKGLDGSAVMAATAGAPTPIDAPSGAPRAILFGMHWLQTGGAERWAIESIALAKAAGFLPIIVTDQNSVHPWISRPELKGSLIILQSFIGHDHPIDLSLTRAILENYDLRGAIIHHSGWLYRSLPYISRHRPGLPIIDSLHIIEYLQGGYVGTAVQYDDFVTTHHVISPQLVHWLGETQRIPTDKLAFAPLNTLTVDENRQFAARGPDTPPFTISFIGRFSRQKRPDIFLLLVHALRKKGVHFRAIMQGGGERQYLVDGLIDRFKLQDVVEIRDEQTSVVGTLSDTDLLVITSINEGLTLTTFEAVAAGVPVLSTDVGSQYSIIEGDMLAPRAGLPFVLQATKQIRRMAAVDGSGEALRRKVWESQSRRVREFNEHTDAHRYFERLFAQWQA